MPFYPILKNTVLLTKSNNISPLNIIQKKNIALNTDDFRMCKKVKPYIEMYSMVHEGMP